MVNNPFLPYPSPIRQDRKIFSRHRIRQSILDRVKCESYGQSASDFSCLVRHHKTSTRTTTTDLHATTLISSDNHAG